MSRLFLVFGFSSFNVGKEISSDRWATEISINRILMSLALKNDILQTNVKYCRTKFFHLLMRVKLEG